LTFVTCVCCLRLRADERPAHYACLAEEEVEKEVEEEVEEEVEKDVEKEVEEEVEKDVEKEVEEEVEKDVEKEVEEEVEEETSGAKDKPPFLLDANTLRNERIESSAIQDVVAISGNSQTKIVTGGVSCGVNGNIGVNGVSGSDMCVSGSFSVGVSGGVRDCVSSGVSVSGGVSDCVRGGVRDGVSVSGGVSDCVRGGVRDGVSVSGGVSDCVRGGVRDGVSVSGGVSDCVRGGVRDGVSVSGGVSDCVRGGVRDGVSVSGGVSDCVRGGVRDGVSVSGGVSDCVRGGVRDGVSVDVGQSNGELIANQSDVRTTTTTTVSQGHDLDRSTPNSTVTTQIAYISTVQVPEDNVHLVQKAQFLPFDNRASKKQNAPKPLESNRASRERRVFMTLTYIIIAYLVCWVPFHFVFDITSLDPEAVPKVLYDFTFWMTYVNSTINPFLYNFGNSEFKQAFKKIVSRQRRRTDRSSNFPNTTSSIQN
ncbi:alpha-2B adrenergic receptor, partial [Biomphalaria pfeifferi]